MARLVRCFEGGTGMKKQSAACTFALLTLSALGSGAVVGAPIAIDSDDIAGVVTGGKGPEAGVWVIAETAELGTPFTKIVVTDEMGQYVLPDLPKGKYKIWVRGYGV